MSQPGDNSKQASDLRSLSAEIGRRTALVGGKRLKRIERLGWASVCLLVFSILPAAAVLSAPHLLAPRLALPVLLVAGLSGLLAWYVKVRSTVSRLREISELWGKYTEVQENMIRQLRQIDVTKKTMMNMASHQMRAPLAAVQSCLRVLLSGAVKEPEDCMKLMNDAYERGEDMMDMVNDMLKLAEARVDSARRIDEIDVEKAVRKIAQFFSVRAAERNVDIRVAVGTAPGFLRADRKMFDHIMLNLISNAFQYSDPNKPVMIHVYRIEDDVKIRVTNWGVVIKPDEMEHIFREFWRSPEAMQRVYRGTGLGLPIVKSIVDTMGGSIDVKSDETNGTSFTVSIPVK
ncbi:MAG TPA: HAMP domain-containing sensor histidine kinase [bacterium]|nr:HAMP domain-containing sensor histidine kinase [bacterium]